MKIEIYYTNERCETPFTPVKQNKLKIMRIKSELESVLIMGIKPSPVHLPVRPESVLTWARISQLGRRDGTGRDGHIPSEHTLGGSDIRIPSGVMELHLRRSFILSGGYVPLTVHTSRRPPDPHPADADAAVDAANLGTGATPRYYGTRLVFLTVSATIRTDGTRDQSLTARSMRNFTSRRTCLLKPVHFLWCDKRIVLSGWWLLTGKWRIIDHSRRYELF